MIEIDREIEMMIETEGEKEMMTEIDVEKKMTTEKDGETETTTETDKETETTEVILLEMMTGKFDWIQSFFLLTYMSITIYQITLW